jgi:N-acetylglutamate synthase-like GNAT family acetyltransferase
MKYGTRIEGHASLKLAVPTALPQNIRGRVVELRSLRTHPDHRGAGEATKLMLATTVEADMHRYFLMLHVQPDEDSPLDQAGLANWYHKFGFSTIQADPMLMVRPCVSAVRNGTH